VEQVRYFQAPVTHVVLLQAWQVRLYTALTQYHLRSAIAKKFCLVGQTQAQRILGHKTDCNYLSSMMIHLIGQGDGRPPCPIASYGPDNSDILGEEAIRICLGF